MLIFVNGLEEIEAVIDKLRLVQGIVTVAAHSELPFDAQLEALAPASDGATKVIAR